MFDNYGETCRVPVIPEQYDRVVCKQKGLASVTFETSEIQGKLEMCEDGAEPMFEEMCADWLLSNMVGDATSSDSAEQAMTRLSKCFDEIAVRGCSNNPVRAERVGR